MNKERYCGNCCWFYAEDTYGLGICPFRFGDVVHCEDKCKNNEFISKKEQKDKIISDFGGMCCEMEGAAIAQTCYLNNTPFVVIRAISDKPDETEIVDYQTFEAKAAARCAKIVRYMVENL